MYASRRRRGRVKRDKRLRERFSRERKQNKNKEGIESLIQVNV